MIDPFAYRTFGFAWRHLRFRAGRRLLRALGLFRPPPRRQSPGLVDYAHLPQPEARRIFTEDPGTQGSQLRAPVAIVLTSAPLRVMMSFVIRVSGSGAYTKFWSNEDEAKQWLHQRLDET